MRRIRETLCVVIVAKLGMANIILILCRCYVTYVYTVLNMSLM